MRYLQIVHAISGRTRMRSPALRGDLVLGERAADALAAVRGVHTVDVRPYTGSILVTHEHEVTATLLAEAVQGVLACARVFGVGEAVPPDPAAPRLSRVAQLAAQAFREIDNDMLRASQGSIDLGTLATLGFFGAGAAQILIEEQIEMPSWFTLAWSGYRTFMTNEEEEIAARDAAS